MTKKLLVKTRKTLTEAERKDYDRAKAAAWRARRTPEQKRRMMDITNAWRREKRAEISASKPPRVELTAAEIEQRKEQRAEARRGYERKYYARRKEAGIEPKPKKPRASRANPTQPTKPLSAALAALRVDMNLVTIARLP